MLASEAPPTNFINIIKHLHLLDQMTPSVYKKIWEKSDGKKNGFPILPAQLTINNTC